MFLPVSFFTPSSPLIQCPYAQEISYEEDARLAAQERPGGATGADPRHGGEEPRTLREDREGDQGGDEERQGPDVCCYDGDAEVPERAAGGDGGTEGAAAIQSERLYQEVSQLYEKDSCSSRQS